MYKLSYASRKGGLEVILSGEHASRATYQMAYVIGRVLNGGTLTGSRVTKEDLYVYHTWLIKHSRVSADIGAHIN